MNRSFVSPRPFELKGLIFDFDGTLADTMPLHWEAWQFLMRKYGFNMTEAHFYTLGGIPSRDILASVNAEHGLSMDVKAVAREKEELYLAMLHRVRPVEPVLNIAREHYGRIPLAVASGGAKHVIEIVLNHMGIRSLFAAVVTNEDVKHQKPAPDIFLEAARRIKVDPQNCRAFEDTDIGLTGIRSAGMEAIDVREFLASQKCAA